MTRLIDVRDAVPFSQDAVSRSVDVTAALAPELADLSTWRIEGADARRLVRPDRLDLESARGDLALRADCRLEAEAVDAIEVVIAGLQPAALPELRWSLDGAAPCADCSLRLMWRDGEGPRRDRFRFEVGSRSSWRGSVAALELRPTNFRNNRVQVERVTLLKRQLDRERLAALGARPSLVSAGNESRPAVLLVQGQPLSTRAEILRGDRLRFGLARSSNARRGIALRVAARKGEAPSVAVATIRLDADATSAGWVEQTVDLAPLGVGAAELSFTLEAEGDDADLRELTFLGSPELEHRHRRAPRPNILFISIDTLRADRLSLYGYERPTSPKLSAWVERGGAIVFEKTVAAAASTLPAHASMFTGLEALHHGAYLSYALRPHYDLLAEMLSDAGYRTLAVTGGGFVHPRFGLAQGFDRFYAWPRGQVDGGDELADGVAKTRQWLAEVGEAPFFLFFHTYETHAPYRVRQPHFSQWSAASPSLVMAPWLRKEQEEEGFLSRHQTPRVWGDGDPRDLRPDELPVLDALYDSGVARVDGALDEILRALTATGHERDTVVIVTSDHGEALGERDFFNHGFLYDHNLLVPLVLRDPRRVEGPLRVPRQVRHIDIVPTLLDLAGLPPRTGIDGVSLASWVREGRGASGLEAWSYAPETNHGIALRKDRMKFILRDSILGPAGPGGFELYQLDADRGEERDLAPGGAPELAPLRRAAFEKLAESVAGTELEWRNRSARPISGVLVWDGARRHNAKWSAPSAATFRMPTPGRLEFTLPGGATARARFMTSGDALRYQVELAGRLQPARASGEIPFVELCAGRRSLIAARLASDTAAAPDLELSAREVGGCSDPGRSDRIDDADLAAGLRALGYLH